MEASGNELLTVNVLKELFSVVGIVIKSSLETGKAPTSLKVSVLKPVLNITNPQKAEEIKPKNLLLEIIMREQLVKVTNMLYDDQSVFRRKYSFENVCQFVLSRWKIQIDERNIIVSVNVDIKPEFVIIDQHKPINTCKIYGVEDTVLKWLESYSKDR